MKTRNEVLMKFRMDFGIFKTIVIVIVMLGALALVGLDIAMLAGAKGVATAMPAVAAVSLAAAVIIALAALIVLVNSFYKFKDDRLEFVLGIFKDKIPYDYITAVKEDERTKDIYIFARGQRAQDAEVSLRMNVSKNKVDSVLEEIRKHLPNMIIEVFTSEDKRPLKK